MRLYSTKLSILYELNILGNHTVDTYDTKIISYIPVRVILGIAQVRGEAEHEG